MSETPRPEDPTSPEPPPQGDAVISPPTADRSDDDAAKDPEVPQGAVPDPDAKTTFEPEEPESAT